MLQHQKRPNKPIQLTPVRQGALLALRLLGRLGCQKQAGVADRRR